MNTVADQLLTFGESAKLLGISLRQFRRLVDSGKIAFIKVSERTPRIRPDDLSAYLEAQTIRHGSRSVI